MSFRLEKIINLIKNYNIEFMKLKEIGIYIEKIYLDLNGY